MFINLKQIINMTFKITFLSLIVSILYAQNAVATELAEIPAAFQEIFQEETNCRILLFKEVGKHNNDLRKEIAKFQLSGTSVTLKMAELSTYSNQSQNKSLLI